MAERKQKLPRFTTPAGILRYPTLLTPDYGTKDFPNKAGAYKTGIILDIETAPVKAFLASLKPNYEDALREGREQFKTLKVDQRKKLEKDNGGDGIKVNDLYTIQYDPTTEEPTGKVLMNFKRKASGVRKDDSTWKAEPPALYDAKGTPITSKAIQIWGGTTAKVNFEVRPYWISGQGAVGLSLMLRGVQIIKLVSRTIETAADMGFGVEDDGFEFDPDAETDPFMDMATPEKGNTAPDVSDDF